MIGLIAFLAGYFIRAALESIIQNKKAATFEQYRHNAMEDLTKFQHQVGVELHEANNEFAKMQLGKLLLETLQDLNKEKHK
jgi:hypothetical protein